MVGFVTYDATTGRHRLPQNDEELQADLLYEWWHGLRSQRGLAISALRRINYRDTLVTDDSEEETERWETSRTRWLASKEKSERAIARLEEEFTIPGRRRAA